ncbi:MAG TPA: spermidine/putrescine ABC transporter substrate-binding protein [Solirubrobacterales bacterium]|nr:spermidine/putrescine ABC transporter substrate-binding protein [Solirubrobacterales bacterium]
MATDGLRPDKAWGHVVAAVAVLALALGLTACGGGGGGGGDSSDAETAKAGPVKGELTISNWPGYIDPGEDGEEGTIAEFEKETGVKVKYIEDVNDNEEFEGKLRPQLEQGDSGGRSIFVVTDWMAKQMYDEGFLQEINPDDLPTVFENMASNLRDPSFDPGRKFSIPWQSGMTGLWVDKSKAPEIKSITDLFDPKYKGKVTMLSEMRDTVALVMKAEGVDPAEASNEDWLKAIDKIDAAADSGQIRRFTGNEYNEDLNAGNVVATIGWSGDASIIGNKNAEWRMPTEGCVLWSDNMVIPVGAPNTAAALGWMEFVYEPEVAVELAEYITYVSPVEGIKDLASPEAANNPLVFPTPEFQKDCSTQVSPPDVAEAEEAWQNVLTG